MSHKSQGELDMMLNLLHCSIYGVFLIEDKHLNLYITGYTPLGKIFKANLVFVICLYLFLYSLFIYLHIKFLREKTNK
jgi:hypothetical protein